MAPPVPNHWTTEPDYIDLLNYVIQEVKDTKSPIKIRQLVRDFKEKRGAAQTIGCLRRRIGSFRKKIFSFVHIDANTKVKLIFALSAPIDTKHLKKLKKDALVDVDDKKRITHYKANDGSLELNGDHSLSAKTRMAMFEWKQSLRSLIINYFETKGNADAIPMSQEKKDMKNLIEYITEKCGNVDSPLNITRLAENFKKHFGISVPFETIRYRLKSYCREIQKVEFLDTSLKVKQLFVLSATVDSDYLEKLRKDASVKVDRKNRITKYRAKDGSLELNGDHSQSAKMRAAQCQYQNFIRNFFEKKNNVDAVPKNRKEKEIWDFIEFITEKCKNVNSPLSITQFTEDFNKHDGIARSLNCIYGRVKAYCRVIQNIESMDTHSKVKQLFGLSATLKLEHLEKLRKIAVVEVDKKNRIIKYISNDNSLTLRRDHWGSKTAKPRRVEKKNENNATVMSDNLEEESDQEGLGDSSDGYSNEEFGSEFDSDEENDLLDETKNLTEPSNEADYLDKDNETSVRSIAHSGITIDDNFDFDPPTERSDETEMREDDEKDDPEITRNTSVKTQRFGVLPKNKTSSSTVHTLKTPKRKAHASESSTSKRTKPLPEESMNPGNSNDNISHDIPSRVELNSFRGPLGLPKETQKDSDIQQIPEPQPQVMEAPIKEEYEEEAQTLLKTVFNAYKSLILGLDTTGLSKLQMELDTKIMEAGRIEISNKEVMMAMDFLIVKLAEHAALKSSEEAISLHDILLMLRTIILNSSFNGLEEILEMLKKNIDQLKVLDKRVPVSKVDYVLRATLDNIST